MRSEYPPGATPLDPGEAQGLLPGHVTTQAELNEWEQANIGVAAAWVRTSRLNPLDLLSVRRLHERMFDRTWAWAGRFRTTEKSLGVAPEHIAVHLRELLDNGRYGLEHGTFPPRECVLRLHHRMVFLQPFPDGNGRHARLWANWILRKEGEPAIHWGGGSLDRAGSLRSAYIASLRAADCGDYAPLLGLYPEPGSGVST
jgi:Fic-DOC domain mobile mystery protein B